MPTVTNFDVSAVRENFPILAQQVHGKPLVYLDNAATSQKPKCVIEALTHFYLMDNANIPVSYTHLTLPTNREV